MTQTRDNEVIAMSVEEPSSQFNFKTVKRGGKHHEILDAAPMVDYEADRETALTALTAEEEKRLIRRVDWRLVPLLCLLYLMKKIDENNASNARIMNKGTDANILTELGITSDQYSLITILYTVPYILAEVPSNLVLKWIRPSRWQSRIMISWGIVTACTAAVSNLGGLYAVRFMLGLTEAGMFPGVILHLTYWYRPDEIAVRLVWIFTIGNISGIISGLLAYGFHEMSGVAGISGWRWLFIIEGIVTILLAFVIWFRLPDFPGTSEWLTPKERAFLQARLPVASPRSSEKDFDMREVIKTLRDKRLWLFTLSWALQTCGASGVKFYQPSIIANMGFSSIATAQILNIPMSVLTIIIIVTAGYVSDRAKFPLPLFPITSTIIVIASYGILVAYPNDIAVYIGMLIGNSFSIAWFPMMWSWRSQTVSGATGSAFAIGFVNSYGQIGDAVGPQMFQDKYEPRYRLPFALAMSLIAACGLTNSYTWWVTRQTERDTRRHKRARLEAKRNNEAILDDVTDHDLDGGRRD
ncbi:MFS domain-containing protein [Fusarium keratoplasticum]|uniref:MFS domain-containing protein n=1 Tax=Fusarium keratoplasticum TaxID=1328300 RepID=A0ACC0RFU6_9HYPO|nr:MFS domain-containing protein [Fusarium keratoplasticum]KAI8685016.1 MFS domain-containing protein [Fusarium keratoplasticum]